MERYDEETRKTLRAIAYDATEAVAGNFLVRDAEIVESHSATEAIEILPMAIALEKYGWLRDLAYTLVPRDLDSYVREVAADPSILGYFIRVRAGERVSLPLTTCYLIDASRFTQRTHNIIIAEESSELHLISGCASNVHAEAGRHIGITEYFIGKNALVTATMIHSWGKEVEVFPRSAAHVGEGGKFVSNYISLGSVKKVQMDPTAILEAGGLGEFYSVIYAPQGSVFDVGSTAVLRGEGASAQMVSRVVSEGGEVLTRGKIIGEKPLGVGSMACNGLLLGESGSIHAIPELVARDPRLELSHEASVGMISREELSYLMAAGIEEEKARSLIIEGFLDLRIPSLPEYLQRQINALVRETKLSETV